MKKRISKRVREQAALICAIAANEYKHGLSIVKTAGMLGFRIGSPQQVIALEARFFASDHGHRRCYELACAEAEAMLRTGWSPR